MVAVASEYGSYFDCVVQSCPPDSTDFRAEQCQKVESTSVPYIDVNDPCKLVCSLTEQQLVENGTVVDGTPCGVSSICVDGECLVSFLTSVSSILYIMCFYSL